MEDDGARGRDGRVPIRFDDQRGMGVEDKGRAFDRVSSLEDLDAVGWNVLPAIAQVGAPMTTGFGAARYRPFVGRG